MNCWYLKEGFYFSIECEQMWCLSVLKKKQRNLWINKTKKSLRLRNLNCYWQVMKTGWVLPIELIGLKINVSKNCFQIFSARLIIGIFLVSNLFTSTWLTLNSGFAKVWKKDYSACIKWTGDIYFAPRSPKCQEINPKCYLFAKFRCESIKYH